MFLFPPDRIKTELTALKVEAMEEKALLLISRGHLATMATEMWMYPRSISFRLCVPAFLVLATSLAGCATGHYTPLGEAGTTEIEQLKESVYRVEYRVTAFTSQEQLDHYLRRRCAELTLREGYDFFHLGQRADVLGLSRRTAMTVTMYKDPKPVGVVDLYHAKDVLTGPASASKTK
jgi:hypothetical protein